MSFGCRLGYRAGNRTAVAVLRNRMLTLEGLEEQKSGSHYWTSGFKALY